ncbi:hypothetical protein ACLMJK_002046 [Lecanora helva]
MDDTASIKSGSQPGSTTSSGTKRKRGNEVKYYAVRVGYRPGVYHTWADCLEQVKGFKKATYKSFSTLKDAERFVAGENPAPDGASSVLTKFYAVKSGRKPGIYTDWPSAQEQITGWQKPKHRCFSTRVEAQRFLDDDDARTTDGTSIVDGDGGNSVLFHASNRPTGPELPQPAQKKTKKNVNGSRIINPEYNEDEFEPGTGPLPPGAEDGFDPNIMLNPETGKIEYKTQEQRQATKKKPSTAAQTEPIRIHTDGSSLGNGQNGAFAGVGVYFGPADKRNISETLPGTRQTNQRAELTAVLRALDTVPRNRNIAIITDSRYAIDCVTSWHINWQKNGWKTSTGKAVENKDIIENVLARIGERDKLGVQTTFEWIKGHAHHAGNVEADKLAVAGAAAGAKNGLA